MAFAINQNVSTYATRPLYVTPAEFKVAGTGIDTTPLVPGGTTAQNAEALVMHLQRASTYADGFCQKVLAATVDTQAGTYRVQSDPWLGPVVKVPLDFTPIVAVSAVSLGWTPSSLAALSDLSGVDITKKTATVPLYPSGGTSTGPLASNSFGGRVHAAVQYINGWANTSLTAGAATGATSITVASPIGVMPGQTLTLWNTNNSETVTVSASWVPTNTGTGVVVPLAAPVVGAYNVGDVATAMPQDIKTAVILIAKSLIKTRGSDSIVLQSVGGSGGPRETLEPGITSDLGLAEDILERYRRVA
jgi:hypothetical protein